MYALGRFLQARLHVPQLGAIGRVRVWPIQEVGFWGTLEPVELRFGVGGLTVAGRTEERRGREQTVGDGLN